MVAARAQNSRLGVARVGMNSRGKLRVNQGNYLKPPRLFLGGFITCAKLANSKPGAGLTRSVVTNDSDLNCKAVNKKASPGSKVFTNRGGDALNRCVAKIWIDFIHTVSGESTQISLRHEIRGLGVRLFARV